MPRVRPSPVPHDQRTPFRITIKSLGRPPGLGTMSLPMWPTARIAEGTAVS